MTALRRLVATELLALRTTRVAPGVVALMALVVVVLAALLALLADASDLRGTDGRRLLALGGAVSYAFAYALGALAMAGEGHHGTLGASLIAAPRRWVLVAAKAVALLLVGGALGLLATLLGAAVVLAVSAARDAPVELTGDLVWLIPVGAVVCSALFGAIGVGIGALVRQQALALALGLVWIVLVDTTVVSAASSVGRFLPGGAAVSLLRTSDEVDVLPGLAGGALLLAYAAVALGAGVLALDRRRVG